MSTSKRPAVQYGKRAQRASNRRPSSLSHSESPNDDYEPAELNSTWKRPRELDNPEEATSSKPLPTHFTPTRRKVEVVLPSPTKVRAVDTDVQKQIAGQTQEPNVLSGRLGKRRKIDQAGSAAAAHRTPPPRSDRPTSSVSVNSSRSYKVSNSPTRSPTQFTPNPRLIPVVEITSPTRKTRANVLSAESDRGDVSRPKSGLDRDSSPALFDSINTPHSTRTSTTPRTARTKSMKPRPLSPPRASQTPDPLILSPHEAFSREDAMTPILSNYSVPGTPKRLTGLAKDMLSRNHTEPDLSTGSTSLATSISRSLDKNDPSPLRTSSLPNVTSPSNTATERENCPSSAQPAAPAISTRPGFRTYSSTRSFLVELPTPAIPGMEGSQHSSIEPIRESYKDLQARWGVDGSDDDPAGLALLNELRSVSELRNKGENRRFLDEMGYLFEGLDVQASITVKRLSAVELISKFSDAEFTRKARLTDVIGRTWDALQQVGAASTSSQDAVLDACLAAFLAFLAREARDLAECAGKDGFPTTMALLLRRWGGNKGDVFAVIEELVLGEEARRMGINKTDKKLLAELETTIQSSHVLPEQSLFATSIKSLLSFTLSRLPSQFDFVCVADSLVATLIAEFKRITPRTDAFATGMDLVPLEKYNMPDIRHISYCCAVLEQVLQLQPDAECLAGHERGLGNLLVNACIYCELIMVVEIQRRGSRVTPINPGSAAKCLAGCFRLLIKLALAKEWCEALLAAHNSVVAMLFNVIRLASNSPRHYPSTQQPMDVDLVASPLLALPSSDPTIRDDDDAAALNLDFICYALALLTRLLQNVEETTRLVSKLALSPTCARKRMCFKSCRCPNKISGPQHLVSMYIQQTELSKDGENAEAHFLRGHLAVLLGLLCGHEPCRFVILRALPTPPESSNDNNRAKVDTLLSPIQDFISLYGEVSRRMANLSQTQNENAGDSDTQTEGIEGKVVQVIEGGDASKSGHRKGGVMSLASPSTDRDHLMATAVIDILESLRDSL